MSKTYSAGIVTAYGAAKRAGYQGTYEDFCRQQAGYAESAAAVEQAKNTAVSAASTATTKATEATTAATAAQTAKTQTEAAASQALTDISTAESGAISAVQTEGATQTANARAQAQAAAQSANTASTKASEASASAKSAGQSATNAAASATSAAQSASNAQDVLDSIPADYSDLSANVSQLQADFHFVTNIDYTQIPFANEGSGYVNTGNGSITSSETFSHTNYIDVSACKSVKYKRSKHTIASPSVGAVFYNDAKAYICGIKGIGNQSGSGYEDDYTEIDVPSDAVFVRFSFYTDTTTFGTFSIYGIGKIAEKVEGMQSAFDNLYYGDGVSIKPSNLGNCYFLFPIPKNTIVSITNNTGDSMSLYTVTADDTKTQITGNFVNGATREFASGGSSYIGVYGYVNSITGTLDISYKYSDVNKVVTQFLNERISGVDKAFTISGEGTYRFIVGLTKGFTYKWTFAGSSAHTLYFMNQDGSQGTSIGTVSANSSVTFTPDSDGYIGLRGYFNSSGSTTLETIKKPTETIQKLENLQKQAFNSSYHEGATDFSTKCKEFSALLLGDAVNNVEAISDFESFLFFTDPHLLEGSSWQNQCYEFIATIQKYYNSTPTTFCLCGGDWLGNSDLPDDACFKMGYIDGFMHSMFDSSYMLVGNHDTNYQGKKDDESATYTTRLSNQSIENLWYRKGKPYFAFDGAKTRFYCFDTGTEAQAMTEYDNYGWTQAQWFANALTTDNSEHIALAAHILYWQYDSSSLSTGIQPLSEWVLKIAQAYNTRTTISVNGTTYDFTASTGNVEFFIAGHYHRDNNGLLYGIPWVMTVNVRKNVSNGPSFDMCIADYDNRLLKMIRVGDGNNRMLDLETGELIAES